MHSQLGNGDRLTGRAPPGWEQVTTPNMRFPVEGPPRPEITTLLTSGMLAGGVIADVGFRTRSHVALAATVDPDIIDSLG